MANFVFTFGEAVAWVMPSGLASQNIGYIRSYSLSRTPVLLEDGSVAFYTDELSIESPWVDGDVTAIFEAAGPFGAFVRWTNTDDGRLASVSVTGARLQDARRAPGDGGVEIFTFRFAANALK